MSPVSSHLQATWKGQQTADRQMNTTKPIISLHCQVIRSTIIDLVQLIKCSILDVAKHLI